MIFNNVEKIDIREYLFHAIIPYDYNDADTLIEDEIKILTNIINTGGLLSRKKLKEILSEEEWYKLNQGHSVNWNKSDWISLAATTDNVIKFPDIGYIMPNHEMGGGIAAFNEFISKYPSIILNPNLVNELVLNDIYSDEYGGGQAGEVQVKDRISTDYFVGIALPNIYDSSDLMKEYILKDYYYEKLKELSVDEFINKFYKEAILIEKALQDIGFELPIYHAKTGNRVLVNSKEKKIITNAKHKIYKI